MGRTVFVVSRRDPELYDYLRQRFASDVAVEVILDRRRVQRRRHHVPFEVERRCGDRRRRPEVDAELEIRSHAIVSVPEAEVD